MYKLGIDVGGTNTDAVLINEDLQVKARNQASHFGGYLRRHCVCRA